MKKVWIVRDSKFLFDKDKNEYVIDNRYGGVMRCEGITREIAISDLKNEVESLVRDRFEVGDQISEKLYYEDRDNDIDTESSLKAGHPVLEYKVTYKMNGKEYRRRIFIWEIYCIEPVLPEVSISL